MEERAFIEILLLSGGMVVGYVMGRLKRPVMLLSGSEEPECPTCGVTLLERQDTFPNETILECPSCSYRSETLEWD